MIERPVKPGWALVVAPGPSLQAHDLELLRPHVAFTLAVNCAVDWAPWANELYFADPGWFRTYSETVRSFRGQLVSMNVKADGVVRDRLRGWSRNGGNSGHQGVQRTVNVGYRKILLTGFDHRYAEDGRRHCHPDHPGKMKNANGVLHWRKYMNQTAKDLQRMGITVINLTRVTALECFAQMTPEQWIAQYAQEAA